MNGSDRCGRLASNLAAYVILTLFVTTAGAQLELPNGLPNCLERCEVTDPQLLRLARSTCALVGKDRMILNADGTYTMLTQSSNSALLLCSDSAWSGQPTYLSGRTGCLVGSDLVLSASHFIHPSDANFCANVWYFVFDYAIMNRGSGCELPSTTIPADLVYECAEIVRHGNFDGEADLILFRLDRPVTGDREPIAVRQSGEPLPGDPIACVHHPERLPQKIETAVTFESISPSIPTPTVIVNGINASFGSSGSPIYNLREDVIESVITGGGCLRSDFSGGCVRLRSACDQTTSDTWGSSVVNFARHLDPYEFAIWSQSPVLHEGPTAGPLSNAITTYRISAPPSAPGPMPIAVAVVPSPHAAALTLELQLPEVRKRPFLNPGEQAFLIVRTASISFEPGVYFVDVALTNMANQHTDLLRHDFRIAQTGFEVSPRDLPLIIDAAPPFLKPVSMVINNTEMNPVDVEIYADADWLTIDGEPAFDPVPPEIRKVRRAYHLAPRGQRGDVVTVVLGVRESPTISYPGDHLVVIDIVNTRTEPGSFGTTQRILQLDTTRAEFNGGGGVEIPDGDPDGVSITLDADEAICIADLNVALHVQTEHPEELIVDLSAPSGTSIRLWSQHLGGGIRGEFDDEEMPPPTGELLSMFDGESAEGTWTLTIRDVVPGNSPASLWSWILRCESAGLCLSAAEEAP